MVMHGLIRGVQIAAALALAWWLAATSGVWAAATAGAIVALVLPAIGVALLRTSELEKITWKNRLASIAMPWGWKFSAGLLGRAFVACAVIWFAIFSLGIVASSLEHRTHSDAATWVSPSLLTVLLIVAWTVDGSVLVYLLGALARNAGYAMRPSAAIINLAAFVAALLGGSMVLAYNGRETLAILVAGLPPLLAGLFAGTIAVLLMLFGHKIRWN